MTRPPARAQWIIAAFVAVFVGTVLAAAAALVSSQEREALEQARQDGHTFDLDAEVIREDGVYAWAFIRCEPSSSLGFGGIAPAGRKSSRPRCQWTRVLSKVAWPMRMSVSPREPSTPRYSATFGRRRSASSRSTFDSACARAIARLQAVVDFPSPGSDEVMTTVRGGLSTSTYCRFVRIVRKASERGLPRSVTSGLVLASGS